MLRFNLNLEEPRPTPKPPSDKLLAKLLLEPDTVIFKYHEHQALLENRPDEELNEEEMKLAWEEYHQEQCMLRCLYKNKGIIIYVLFPVREIEGKMPVPPPNVTNAFFEQNMRMEELNLANSSHAIYSMQHGTHESIGLNQTNAHGNNSIGMETATFSEQRSRYVDISLFISSYCIYRSYYYYPINPIHPIYALLLSCSF